MPRQTERAREMMQKPLGFTPRFAFLEPFGVDVGYVPHVVAGLVIFGGRTDMLARQRIVAIHFVVKTDVEVRVKKR